MHEGPVIVPQIPVEELATDHESLGIRGKQPLEDLDIDPHELEAVLALLPPIEADIIQMSIWGMGQKAIGGYLGCTQANVSYRLRKAPKRLRNLKARPSLAAIEQELIENALSEKLRRVVLLTVELTTLVAAARTLWPNATPKEQQGRVHYAYYRGVQQLRPSPIKEFLRTFAKSGTRTLVLDPTKNHSRRGRPPKKKAPDAHRSGDDPGTSGA